MALFAVGANTAFLCNANIAFLCNGYFAVTVEKLVNGSEKLVSAKFFAFFMLSNKPEC